MGRKPNTAHVTARRDEILRKAIETFRELGYNNTTIEEIAARLNVTKASIYYYVEGKQDLLFEAHRSATEALLTGLREIATRQLPARVKLEQAIRHHIVTVIDELSLATELLQHEYGLSTSQRKRIVKLRDEYDRLFRHIIVEGMGSGVFRSADAKMASFVILGAVNWMPHWFSHDGALKKEELAGLVSDYLLGGLLRRETTTAKAADAAPDVFGIAGRLIVVTGAASAPGRSVAWMLVKNGARVVLVDHDEQALEQVTTALRAYGYGGSGFAVDLTQERQVTAFVEATTTRFGSIDGLVYTRLFTRADTSLLDVAEGEWRQLVNTNLTGAFLMARAVSQVMRENRDGSIVLLTTMPNAVGESSWWLAALRAITTPDTLTETLSQEMAPHHVRVNAVIGGITRPGSLSGPRLAEGNGGVVFPEIDDATMLFLLSPASRHVTGQTLQIEDHVRRDAAANPDRTGHSH